MTRWKIPLFKIYWDKSDLESVSECLKRGMHWASGPEIVKFERMIAEYVGTKYALVFNSGTSALHASLMAHNISEGAEVVVPSFTFIATANAPLFVRAKPKFADIEENSWGLDPEDVNRRIGPKTRAVIVVHYGGLPCLIDRIREIADEHKLILIEDAAEALGSKLHKRQMGTYGDSAILSFCSNKVITTGEGGAIVTDSKQVYERAKLARSHGREERENYFSSTEYMDYTSIGHNFRMSSITAALGISQMRKITKILDMRRANAKLMDEALSSIPQVTPLSETSERYHTYQMYSVRVPEKERDRLIAYLKHRGIMTKVYFYPVHLTSFYRRTLGYKEKLEKTETISREELTLPMYPSMTEKEINQVATSIRSFFLKR